VYIGLFYGDLHHFQQYFSNNMAVSFIGGGNRRTPLTTGGELVLHMLHPLCYSLTTRTSSDMEIKNFIPGMNPGMRNLKRINPCGALNKPSLQGK
jgi:hypothetical protein